MQLLIDEFRDTHFADALDVARSRSVGDAIQKVHDRRILSRLGCLVGGHERAGRNGAGENNCGEFSHS
jgi:hypothetical protein